MVLLGNERIHPHESDPIYETLFSADFPWYYQPVTVWSDDKKGTKLSPEEAQFTHMFYTDNQPVSKYFPLLKPILEKLDARSIIRIKANLKLGSKHAVPSGMHTDVNYLDSKTAVYYVNTCDGYTQMEDGSCTKSDMGRVIWFPSNTKHQGCTCTDEQVRVVINFNYF